MHAPEIRNQGPPRAGPLPGALLCNGVRPGNPIVKDCLALPATNGLLFDLIAISDEQTS